MVTHKAADMKRSVLFVIVGAVGLNAAFCRDIVEVESRYTGNGCFQYTVRTLEDPFVTDIYLGNLIPQPFTNYVSSILPPHWTNFVSDGQWWGIAYDVSSPQPRLNGISFSICSSSTSFRRGPYGFQTVFAVLLADCFRIRYISGYHNLPCLVPCAPEEADGSESQLVSRFELIPDLIINQLILTNGEVYGLTFSGVSLENIELQGSPDLTNWTVIARFAGSSPGMWTTNSALNAYGEFFRLRAVSVKY